jgi:hypothetical protein
LNKFRQRPQKNQGLTRDCKFFLFYGDTQFVHNLENRAVFKNTRTKVGIKTVSVTNKSVIDCNLLPSGGQAILIEPADGA